MAIIVINADDFGLSETVSRAIIQCFETGFLSTTTLMVNMPYAEEACKLARENGVIEKVGLHFNVTEGFPLSKRMSESSFFCDKSGRFNANYRNNFIYRSVKLSKSRRLALQEEFMLQLSKYRELTGNTGHVHIDSHHHAHTDLCILSCLIELIENKKIDCSIRVSRNIGISGQLKKIYKRYVNSIIGKYKFTDYMGSYNNIINATNGIDDALIEWMVHPDFVDGKCVDKVDGKYIDIKDEVCLYHKMR